MDQKKMAELKAFASGLKYIEISNSTPVHVYHCRAHSCFITDRKVNCRCYDTQQKRPV